MTPDTPPVVTCSACRQSHGPTEVLAFWPSRDPSEVRYVCRPERQARCFKRVGPASRSVIAATPETIATYPPGWAPR